jgi:hypothetical protein
MLHSLTPTRLDNAQLLIQTWGMQQRAGAAFEPSHQLGLFNGVEQADTQAGHCSEPQSEK